MNIKEVLKNHGWSLLQIAERMTDKKGNVGVSHATVSQIVNGNPTLDKLQEIANIVGIPLSQLIAEAENSQPVDVFNGVEITINGEAYTLTKS